MEIRPEHEVFGREIKFNDVSGIKKVFQPGILNRSYFFNPESLRQVLPELCGYGSKNILVYFNEISYLAIVSDDEKKRKWWGALQDFIPLVKDLPAGFEMEYWYGPDGKEYSSPEFKTDK